MTDSKRALYRLDYRTDLTSIEAPTINLGYMLEAAVENGFRFLGLASRKALTPLEMDLVNLHTWPEMADLDGFMDTLFARAWDHVCEAEPDDLRLGCESIAFNHSAMSALHFASLEPIQMDDMKGDVDALHRHLYDELLRLGGKLKPVLTAPVISLPKRRMPVPNPDISFPKYRAEAEYGRAAA
ncbi:hypothetical protein SAMN05518849_1011118 [Sphingobium sp. AP50]|uniref:hypothetical protein n=1 Tax=Sphingobium sp. AP50 TaxID=1884369 RepID=UPI0008BA102C|nr:hypothetical protein [Sphingobium sp. AP50]SEI85406.1 hypothetical protein SAMN05518849_1011118 [Sphingobium sp. AP50]